MSKCNVFISVIVLPLLSPLCQAADVTQAAQPAGSIRSLGSIAAKVWAQGLKQQVEQGCLTQGEIEEIAKISEPYLQLIAKEYYLLANEERDQLPEWLQDHFEGGIRVLDLIAHDKATIKARWDGKKELYLSHKHLVSCDNMSVVPDVDQLQILYLFNNKLQVLPDLALSQLELLCLGKNELTALSGQLNLPALRMLDLSENELTALSSDNLNQLTELRILDLHDNRLETLPDNLDLNKLELLDLRKNKLKVFPQNYNFPALNCLRLENNQWAEEAKQQIRGKFPSAFITFSEEDQN